MDKLSTKFTTKVLETKVTINMINVTSTINK